jgi:nitroimidazol reductase NimA-like FMN-containing flavoprotein (pyridoxamine 5'-phosphate oxidase superfamily)
MSDSISPEVERLLQRDPLLAHLATAVDDRPHVAPVWFRYEDGLVELMTTGQKLANLRENPRVALSVAKGQGADAEWTVTLRGTATVVEDETETREANRRINRRYGVGDEVWDGNTLVRVRVGSASHRTYV